MYALAIRAASRAGVFIKQGQSLEKLLKIKSLFFDKTGTVTLGEIKVCDYIEREPSDSNADIIYALEALSQHPIALSLRDYFSDKRSEGVEITDWQEIPGHGVFGFLEGARYELSKANGLPEGVSSAKTCLSLKRDGKEVAYITIADQVRPESREVLKKLQVDGRLCHLLSGDTQAVAEDVARQLDMQGRVWGEQTPDEKKSVVKSYENTMMIGDGANDASSLREADVSVAVHGGMDLSLRAADIFLKVDGIQILPRLFHLAHGVRSTMKRNISFSLLYNIAGASLALAGYIHPIYAAVLMPLSSLTVLSSSFYSYFQFKKQMETPWIS